jgi:hypothetical protein
MATVSPSVSQSSSDVNSTQSQVGASGGNQTGTINNQQQVNATQSGTLAGQQNQNNVYLPWQQQLQGTVGTALNNYGTTGTPPPGVVGADQALNQAYTDSFNQFVAPQIAASGGPGSPALGSDLALGLEQLNANVYGTNLGAYETALGQGVTASLTPTGVAGAQGQTTTGTSAQNSTSNTQQQQDWQQALADLLSLTQSTSSLNSFSPGVTTP